MPNKIGFRTASLVFLTGLLPFATLSVAPPTFAAPAQISVGVTIGVAPPPLPLYTQPPCPGDNYIWAPGYWAWEGDDYYWVPGTWVEAPDPGLFWTPGYWAWENTGYVFVPGYWGPTVGFYGGIDYGFGYTGNGYHGGRWNGSHFYYNTAVNNVNVRVVRNTYVDRTVVVNNSNRVSFNGGNGGVQARASAQDASAARNKRMGAVAAQTRQVQDARSNQMLRASYNHGAPPVAATPKAGTFSGSGIVAAHNAPSTNRPAGRPANTPPPANNHGPANNNAHPNPATRPNPGMRPNNTPPAQQNTPNETRQRMERQPSPNGAPMTRQTNPQPQHQQMQPQQHPQQPTQQRPQEPQRTPQHQPTARPAPQAHEQAQPRPTPQQHVQPHAQPQPHGQSEHQQSQRQDQH